MFEDRCNSVAAIAADISIVIPVHCEEENIPVLYQRLERVAASLSDIRLEYIFVNDGSRDNSISVLRQLARADSKVKVIDFSRNFGKEVALTAGCQAARTEAVICMDADLQHPPELIPRLIDEWRRGAEVVATIRTGMDDQPLMRRLGSQVFYWLMRKMSNLDMISQTTDFRLLDKKVLEALRTITEHERIFRGVIDWMGFKKVYVEFHAVARKEGAPAYSYAKLWRLAVSSITAFSMWPLRTTGYLGVLITTSSGLLLAWMLGNYAFVDSKFYTPLAIVVVINTFLIGIVLMAIGLVALYVGTIHTEVVNRPLYIVREWLNFEEKTNRQ